MLKKKKYLGQSSTLFRGDSKATKAVRGYLKSVGEEWMSTFLAPTIKTILNQCGKKDYSVVFF